MEITYITSEVELGNDVTIRFSGDKGTSYVVNFVLLTPNGEEVTGYYNSTGQVFHYFPETGFVYDGNDVRINMPIADFITPFTQKSMTMKAVISDENGSSVSAAFTVTIPENDETKPTLWASLETRQHGSVPSIEGDYTGIIQGKTRVCPNIIAEGKFGAEIKEYSYSVEGVEYKEDTNGNLPWSAYIAGVGKIVVTVKVVDSRGITASFALEDGWSEPYHTPRLLPATDSGEIVVERCDESGTPAKGGTYLKIANVKVEYSHIDKVSETCDIQYRYRAANQTFDSDDGWESLNPTTKEEDGNTLRGEAFVDERHLNLGFDRKTTYYVELRALDAFGAANVAGYPLPSLKPYAHWAGELNSLGLGCEVTTSNTLKVGWNVHGNVFGLAGLPEIPEGTDIDDWLDFGTYSVPTGSRAKTLSNLPVEAAGRLVVCSPTGTGAKIQDGEKYTYVEQRYHQNGEAYHYLRYIHIDNTGAKICGAWICTNADFFVESGSGDHYTYKRSNSGQLQLWYDVPVSGVAVTTALGSWYRSGAVHCDWPIPITPNRVLFSWTSNSGHGAKLWNTALNTTRASFYLIRPTTDSGASGSIHLYAEGT